MWTVDVWTLVGQGGQEVRKLMVYASADGASAVVSYVNESGKPYFDDGMPLGEREENGGYVYLMADPACPHLAPWAPPVEVSK